MIIQLNMIFKSFQLNPFVSFVFTNPSSVPPKWVSSANNKLSLQITSSAFCKHNPLVMLVRLILNFPPSSLFFLTKYLGNCNSWRFFCNWYFILAIFLFDSCLLCFLLATSSVDLYHLDQSSLFELLKFIVY